MNKPVLKISLAVVLVAIFMMCGCKKADANKPIPEVKAEAEKMDVSQLRDMAMKYKDAIADKMEKIKDEGMKLKDIPPADMMAGKGKDLTAKIDELKKTVDALKERFQIYVDEIKKKGGDITGLQI
jgi:outer membrane murein-binding lipoprotein Lpp